MLTLPPGFQRTISVFSTVFRKDVWPKALLLITGAIICPGSRTVCNLLRSTGLQAERCFPKYHRLLSQDKWSARRLSGVLLKLLVDAFLGVGEALVFERSTPCLMALMSIVCLMANTLHLRRPIQPNATAWYRKTAVTFSDVLSAVRLEIWRKAELSISHFQPDVGSYSAKIRHLWFLLTQAVA
ncbi:MAG: transposase [Phaeodactylibacter sp.]|nr:transposase [Phaeodactylibacter sp.]